MSYRTFSYDHFYRVLSELPHREIKSANAVLMSSLVDLTAIEEIRREQKQRDGTAFSYTTFVAKALSCALKEFPYANRRNFRSWIPFRGIRAVEFQNVDIAIAVEKNLEGRENVAYTEILRDVDRDTLANLQSRLLEMRHSTESTSARWREFSDVCTRYPWWLAVRLITIPSYSPDLWVRYRGASAIISSPAKYGVDRVLASWSWPLGISFGLVKERPMVVDGHVVARPSFELLMSFDRTIMAGAQAARFFRRMVDLLELREDQTLIDSIGDSCKKVEGGPSDVSQQGTV